MNPPTTQHTRPHPVRALSSSAAQSPFHPFKRGSSQPPDSRSRIDGQDLLGWSTATGDGEAEGGKKGWGVIGVPWNSTGTGLNGQSGGSMSMSLSTSTSSGLGGTVYNPMERSSSSTFDRARPFPAGEVGSRPGQGNGAGGGGSSSSFSTTTGSGWLGSTLHQIPGTRSNSFSRIEGRSPRTIQPMPSHEEESFPKHFHPSHPLHPSLNADAYHTPNPSFPNYPTTFSETSSPESSPRLPNAALPVLASDHRVDHHRGHNHGHPHAREHGREDEHEPNRPHSPPRAELNVSRSRSQSMVPGSLRPGLGSGLGMSAGMGTGMGNGMGMTVGMGMGFTGSNPGQVWDYHHGTVGMEDGWGVGKSRFFKDAGSGAGAGVNSAQGQGQGQRKNKGMDEIMMDRLSASVQAALGGFTPVESDAPYGPSTSSRPGYAHPPVHTHAQAHGQGNHASGPTPAGGISSGSSSRRHSISVAGGPNSRRGFQIPGFGFSEALVSPEIEGRFGGYGLNSNNHHDNDQGHDLHPQQERGSFFPQRGRRVGFSDTDLGFDLGKLNLSVEGMGRMDAQGQGQGQGQMAHSGSTGTGGSFDDRVAQARRDSLSAGPRKNESGQGADWLGRAPAGVAGNGFVAGMNQGQRQQEHLPFNQPPAAQNASMYNPFAPGPRQDGFNNGINSSYNAPAGAYGQGRGQPAMRNVPPPQMNEFQPTRQQLFSMPAKVSPFAPGQAPSFVGSIGSGPTMLTPQAMSDMGKGIPLQILGPNARLFIVEFKAGRTDLFYTPDPNVVMRVGDLVIVEADRGQDLGKVKEDKITIEDVRAFNAARKQEMEINGPMSARIKGALTNILNGEVNNETGPNPNPAVKPVQKEIMPKRIFGKAGPADQQLLTAKLQDEAQALSLCQQRVKMKRLPMEVLDAEYQWDRRKLTFYFIAEKRIDFRELVRELFRIHKTRIWMASLDHSYLQDEEPES